MSVEGARTATAQQRLRIYKRLNRRNRWIAVLRLAVPCAGAVVLAGLLVQIVFFSASGDFSIGRVTVDRDVVTVESPRYSGVTADGSTYTVQAATAKARLDAADLIDLTDATLVLVKPDASEMHAAATDAALDSARQQVNVPGVTRISNSAGAHGTVVGGFLDSKAQVMTASGAVDMTFPDGMTLKANGLRYDWGAAIWTFSGARITMPTKSGEPEVPSHVR